MSQINEDELKKRLGLETWRNMSKEKLVTFVSDLPNLSTEVALKIVEQFPDFKQLANGALEIVQEHARFGIEANWKGQKRFQKSLKAIRKEVQRELDRDDLNPDQRFRVLQLLFEVARLESSKDSEQKSFIANAGQMVAGVAVVAVVAAVAILGGKGQIGGKS